MFLWNTMFFFCLASMKTYVSCLPRSILLVLLGKIFFSMRWNSGYSFEDDTFHQGKLLTDNVITVNFSSTRQFSSTVFDILLPSKNCWTFSDYFHLGIVNFEGLSEGFYACYQTVLHLLLFLVFSSHFNIHLSRVFSHYWSKQSYASFFYMLTDICNCLIFARKKVAIPTIYLFR